MSAQPSERPLCCICNKPLVLLDPEEQRWYCYKDDKVYFAKEARWLQSVQVVIPEAQRPKCLNCGAQVVGRFNFCAVCGQPLEIDVERVLNSTIGIIKKNPIILLPVLLEAIVTSSLGWWFFAHPIFMVSGELARSLVAGGVSVFLAPLLRGTYPSMVRQVIRSNRLSLAEAFQTAAKKYAPLVMSSILVTLGLFGGSLLLGFPGLILATWYFYTNPAIVLEDLGAMKGMSASKRFGRKRKMNTFILLLVASVPTFLSAGFEFAQGISVSSGGYSLPSMLVIIMAATIGGALGAITSAFTYMTYALPKGSNAISQSAKS